MTPSPRDVATPTPPLTPEQLQLILDALTYGTAYRSPEAEARKAEARRLVAALQRATGA